MEHMQIVVVWVMRVGVFLAFLLVITGGVFYLWQHGQDIVHYELLPNTADQKLSLTSTSFPLLLIDFGVLILVLTQILRVAFMGWCFVRMRDYKFSFITIFILLMLLGIFFSFF